jgi:cyclopropane fatty-acyl-phospholipid synthase-like methyltransferase
MTTIDAFYYLIKRGFAAMLGRQYMLHYPMLRDSCQDLMQWQIQFTDYCLSRLPRLHGKCVLDIGCGNGVQTCYIRENHKPLYLYGIDVSEMQVRTALQEMQARGLDTLAFAAESAQRLDSVAIF